jgi:hypothetical protein
MALPINGEMIQEEKLSKEIIELMRIKEDIREPLQINTSERKKEILPLLIVRIEVIGEKKVSFQI